MIHYLSEKIAVFLFDDNDKYPLEVYIYGIELTISSVSGMMIVLTIGLISGCLSESMIFLVSLSLIRFFSGGYHATSYLRCNIILVISYIFTLFVYLYQISYLTRYTYIITIMLFVILFIILAIFAPVKNVNKDISQNDKMRFKVISIVLLLLILMMFVLLYEFLRIKQVVVILPTIMVVSISILVEIILQKRRKFNERLKTEGKEND